MQREPIVLKNVRVHNLKGVDLTLHPGRLIVFTGVSGSGKSSLAFDTIHAEGQRRYIESLSHHARRFLAELTKPDAESISGIAPTVAIEQKLSGRTPRSTVGTMAGIYDFLRVLYARVATPHCPVSGEALSAMSREKILSALQTIEESVQLIVLAPYAKAKKAEFKEDFADLLRKGFTRVRIDGNITELEEVEPLDSSVAHDIDLVIDRIEVSKENRSRLSEAAVQALDLGEGFFSLFFPGKNEEILYSQYAYAKQSQLSYGPLEPHDFSFNHPSGMCPSCHGLGTSQEFDLTKIIDPEQSIAEDCCSIASSYQTVRYGNIFNNLARLYKFKISTPWKKLSEEAKEVFLYGTGQKWTKMRFAHPHKATRWTEYVRWQGVIHEAKERFKAAKSELYRKKMKELMTESICPECQGAKIKAYPAAAQLGGKTITELSRMTLFEALQFFQSLKLSDLEEKIAEELIKEIKERLGYLIHVGVHYLTLERIAPSLSGGESQRVRLASQIGSGLVGAIYILDEPSIGLHPSDHHKLLSILARLRDEGNTVIVVEHDLETMLAADEIVDVGPLAGIEGGRILAKGCVEALMKNRESLTGAYLSGRLKIEVPKKRRPLNQGNLNILGAAHHNLKNIDVSIPLGGLICITGVSGSGKSSLISDILAPALSCHFHNAKMHVGQHKEIQGMEQIDKAISVDQSPIGRTPRSNAATYIKLFDEIRAFFSELPESKLRGFTPSHFSFNVKEGSCRYCKGLGSVKVDMDFMEDAQIKCPQCKGRRFDPDILRVEYKNHSIYDLLNASVNTSLELFDAHPSIRRKLEMLQKVGLGYLTLGQSSTTLSGGEAQRIKLAKELVRPSGAKTLYILDEPSTGLHFHDLKNLIAVFNELLEKKSTIILIEHNMDLAKVADWIIDLGPEAGEAGGRVIGEGTPEQLAKKKSATGKALKKALSQKFTPTPAALSPLSQKKETIEIKNASQNNLKNVSISIPRSKMTVFTGPSGSGKSSLAFETLYAESQRRYSDTLPAYARQAIKQLPKPKVEHIDGLSPAIALEQKTGGLNPRSTIGTITEIYDWLRILFAHLGVAHCPDSGEIIQRIDKASVVERILSLPKNEKLQLLSPLLLPKKESFQEMQERLNREGFLRIRLNQKIYRLDEEIPFEKHKKNELFLVVDRVVVEPNARERLFESIEKCTQLSNGLVIVAREKEDLVFNLAFFAEKSGKSYPPITPQTFSFNASSGMCLDCQGLGAAFGAHLEEEKSVLRLSALSLLERFWHNKSSSNALKLATSLFKHARIDFREPLKKLSPNQLSFLFNGEGSKEKPLRKKGLTLTWVGLHPLLARLARFGKSSYKQSLLPFLKAHTCPSCEGERLNSLARHVTIKNLSLPKFCKLSIEKAGQFMERLSLPVDKQDLLQETLEQIRKAIRFLIEMGMDYLSLDRSAPTLSGGELQRIRLARQLGSGLTSCLYVLDEPTIGLHPHNSDRLFQALSRLRDLGNTLVLVEHDPLIVEKADYLFDFGPLAGARGGYITAQGTLPEIRNHPNSLTGAYLSGRKRIEIPKTRRPFQPCIHIENASTHNLKNLSITLSKASITCFSGVSGSGKSTLMSHLLKKAAQIATSSRKKKETVEIENARITGLNAFENVIAIDQSPIGQTARADVSTYTDIQPLIRSHFAQLPLSRAKGLLPRHFSPNHLRGMCRTCWGLGFKVVDLQFLPSIRMICDACHGARLNPISLEVLYKEKHFGQILKMSVEEAYEFFSPIPRLAKRLQTLIDVGLSYLHLGQEVASLSGGEAQRLRLSRELSKREIGKTLYLIDEPTVGLHSEDIQKLLQILHRLADKKNTLLLIEHNLDILANSDWIVDLGPNAGERGGEIIAQGTPEEIAQSSSSYTGFYLKKILSI